LFRIVATYPLPKPLPSGLPVVLDTNVVLSLWMFEDPALVPLRAALDDGRLTSFTRDDCSGELARVLAYHQFKQPPERQATLLAAHHARSIRIEVITPPAYVLPNCLDRDDQKFLEIARDSGAAALLTRDKLVLKLGRRTPISAHFAIISPEAFQRLLT
jgi:putative PIN family toxin of toxin-antitoxin system